MLHPKSGLSVEINDTTHSAGYKKVYYSNNEAFLGEQEKLLSKSKNGFREQEITTRLGF